MTMEGVKAVSAAGTLVTLTPLSVTLLTCLIGMGLVQAIGSMMYPKKVYQYETEALLLQAVAQDWVTGLLCLPALILALVSLLYTERGGVDESATHRHHLLTLFLLGVMAYFVYTYTSYVFVCHYSRLFLFYVTLMSLSWGVFLSILPMALSVPLLPPSSKTPTVAFLSFSGVFIAFMWLSALIPAAISGKPPAMLAIGGGNTLAIQALDLAFVVPLCACAVYAVVKETQYAMVLSAIMFGKAILLGAAVASMALYSKAKGETVSVGELALGPTVALLGVGAGLHFYTHLRS
ncbi:hypothetical protein KIPB_009186 [Kipferlia bialata]|uniref:Uncharacterized protein n=1 Tax=Kipferlia bialata TaxID=797122 RepID=A0A9K3GLX5_9EUKA|nr:hypothetical protein KIPB_009186 [Kipferlia bialata]|eukprot:g9186.t1